MTVRVIERPLMNASEAFERAELGGEAIETDYTYGTLNNTRSKVRKNHPKRKYKIQANKDTGKYLIIRTA